MGLSCTKKALSCRFFFVYHKLQTHKSDYNSRLYSLIKLIPLVLLTLFAQNGRYEDAKEPVFEV